MTPSDPFLVVFDGKDGHARRVARDIADTVRRAGFAVATGDVDGEEARDPGSASVITAVATVERGGTTGRVGAWLARHHRLTNVAPSFLVAISLRAASSDAAERTGALTDAGEVLRRSGSLQTRIHLVGGVLDYPRAGVVGRAKLRREAERLGLATDTTAVVEYTDRGDVRRFAEGLLELVGVVRAVPAPAAPGRGPSPSGASADAGSRGGGGSPPAPVTVRPIGTIETLRSVTTALRASETSTHAVRPAGPPAEAVPPARATPMARGRASSPSDAARAPRSAAAPRADARSTSPAVTRPHAGTGRTVAGVDAASGLWDEERIAVEIGRCSREAHRYGFEMTLLALTVDGDPGPDAALTRTVASVVRRAIRSCDHCARLADGTFVVLLPHTSTGAGSVVALRLAREIESHLGGGADGLGVGVATLAPTPGTPASTWLSRARAAMTEAREAADTVVVVDRSWQRDDAGGTPGAPALAPAPR